MYSFVLWMVGFIWSMVVFAIPTLWDYPAIAGVSKHPPISITLEPVYVVLIYVFARRYLGATDGGPSAVFA